MIDIYKKDTISICFTGHRPKDLYGYYEWSHPKNVNLMKYIKRAVNTLIKDNLDKNYNFYFGGAIGVDQFAFKCVNDLKKSEYVKGNVSMILCVPFRDQESEWNDLDQMRYTEQYLEADKIVLVDQLPGYKMNIEGYHPGKLMKRNQYMVDNSDIVLAVWKGSETGGTANTVKYAKKQNKIIMRLDPIDLSMSFIEY